MSFEELMVRRKLRKGIRNTWKHGKYVNLYGKHKVIRKESIFLITVCILYFVIILDQTEFWAILRLKDLNYERLFLIFSITIILLVFKKVALRIFYHWNIWFYHLSFLFIIQNLRVWNLLPIYIKKKLILFYIKHTKVVCSMKIRASKALPNMFSI